jgi:hypothetical protein
MQELTLVLLTLLKVIFFLITFLLGYKLSTFNDDDEELNLSMVQGLGKFVSVTSVLLLLETIINIVL